MTDQQDCSPATEQEWQARIDRVNRQWRRACIAQEDAARAMQDANLEVDTTYKARARWRNRPEQIRAAWEPILARVSREMHAEFTLADMGSGGYALRATLGLVSVVITDYGDGVISHPRAGKGWWMGFELPDAAWSGRTESIIGDPDARSEDEFVKFVAYALSGWLRGERHMIAERPSDHDDGIPRIDYGDE